MDRRAFVMTSAAALATPLFPAALRSTRVVELPLPSPAQLRWQRDELALFLHFGVNTFTDREWGDGTEDPAIFNPTSLDAGQWARAARAAGAKTLILTAKHHDGFCLWPTRTTSHSVAGSPFRGGRGDVVRELVDACRANGLRAGVYLSPWDRNAPVYGDSPRYNDTYVAQLTELLTNYGELAEVWFDGANGEGPNGRKQVYDWPRVFATVRRLQPNAVIFSDAGPDVRWCGNERGVAGDPNWATVDPASIPYIGAGGDAVTAALQHGDPRGSVWRPAEVDVSIRPGWFYHPAEDAQVRSVDNLVDLYFTSVGHNGKLLLNVPPTRDGLLHATDVQRLADFRAALDSTFAHDLAARAERDWRVGDNRSAELELELRAVSSVSTVRLGEDITRGQRVAKWSLWGSTGCDWQPLARGTTIGYARLERFATARVKLIRLNIDDAIAEPRDVSLQLFG